MSSNNSILINKPVSKRTVWLIIIVTVVFVFATNLIGEKDPTVNVYDDSIEIKSMFGTNINMDDIEEISLLDESMREIGIGIRTNGFGGFFGANKGHFEAKDGSKMLIFTQANSVPTIQIQIKNGPPVYISFRDPSETIALFNELQE